MYKNKDKQQLSDKFALVHTHTHVYGEKIPENIPIQIAEERENRYVANHEMIGSTPVTTKAMADAIAQPRYTDDA